MRSSSNVVFRSGLVFGAFVAIATLWAGNAAACSFMAPDKHTTDPNEVAVDKEPPGEITSVAVRIGRGKGPEGFFSKSSTSCDDLGSVSLTPTPPSDNRTPVDKLGYVLALDSGTLPEGMGLGKDALRLQGGSLVLRWVDGATDDQEPIAFDVRIAAVDLAGNKGPDKVVKVRDAGDSGCSAAGRPRSASAGWLVLFLALGVLLRRRFWAAG